MPQPQSSSDSALRLTSSSQNRILTDVEVAERRGVSRFTVRSWRLKGVGPRFLKMGRAVRYRSEDVDEYEQQALVETQASSDHAPMSSRAASGRSRPTTPRRPSETGR
jgi:predicted DNA-binding transcriptional regulator AlpA